MTFQIGGRDYRVENVYYPEGEEQLAWVRWTTPKEEQVMEIPVTVEGGGTAEKGIITARITELGKNPLRTRMRTIETIAFRLCRYLIGVKQQRQDGVCGSRGGRQNGSGMRHRRQRKRDIGLTKAGGSFAGTSFCQPECIYGALGDEKSPTANGKTMKSGYGFHERVMTSVQTDQPDAVTPAQNAVTYFPEFGYKTFWRLLERMGDGYGMTHEFLKTATALTGEDPFYSIWYPDGSYTPYTWLMDCWTPAGMLAGNLTDTLQIQGNLWEDWHIAPQNPWR